MTEFIPKSPAYHTIEVETEEAPVVEPSKNKPKLARRNPTQDSDANVNTPLSPLSDPNGTSAVTRVATDAPNTPRTCNKVPDVYM